ncbi:MAG: dCTP deaminase [Candidatus Micrarchaeia archaeon]
MFLSDKDILEAMEKKELVIEPFSSEQMTSNGYDLKIMLADEGRSDGYYIDNNQLVIKSGAFLKVKTEENVSLANGYIAFMWLRSKYSRNGLFGSTAVIDSGFSGRLYLSIKNLSNEEIRIDLSKGAVHIVFGKLISKSITPYGSTEKSHFQNQK